MSVITVAGVDDAVTTLPTACFPVANLIPAAVTGQRKVARARMMAMGGVAVAVLGVGGLWVLSSAQASDAEAQLAAAQTQGAQLLAQQAKFAEIPRVAGQVTAAKDDLGTALQGEVAWSAVLTTIQASAPEGITVQRVTGSLPSQAAPGGAVAAQAAGIGQVTIAGTAASFPEVSAWLRSLGKVSSFESPTLTRSARDQGAGEEIPVAFEGTVSLSAQALVNPSAATAAGSTTGSTPSAADSAAPGATGQPQTTGQEGSQ